MAEVLAVEIRPRDWQARLGRRIDYVTRRAIELTAQDLWGNVRREAPVHHGRLAGSFLLVRLGELVWRIWTPVKYAVFVHEGHGIIRPVRARMLRFTTKGGEVVFARQVKAVPANKYVDRAVRTSSVRVSEFARRAAAEAGG